MRIKVQHKNGTPLQFTVNADELTDEMRAKLIVPAGDSIEDYANFDVWCNKHGEVRRIRPGMYSKEKSRHVCAQAVKPSLIDALDAIYRHDGKAIDRINAAADMAGIGHSEAKHVIAGAFNGQVEGD